MRPSIPLLVKFMRFFFLLLSFSSIILCVSQVFTVLLPDHVQEGVAVVSVQQPLPVVSEEALFKATQRVAASHSSQLVPQATTSYLIYNEPSAARRLLLRLIAAERIPLPSLLTMAIFATLLSLILWDFRLGEPFTANNVRRLRWLALLLSGFELYEQVAQWWLKQYLASITPAGMTAMLPSDQFHHSMLPTGIVGAILVLLAVSFQRGVDLTKEVELTV